MYMYTHKAYQLYVGSCVELQIRPRSTCVWPIYQLCSMQTGTMIQQRYPYHALSSFPSARYAVFSQFQIRNLPPGKCALFSYMTNDGGDDDSNKGVCVPYSLYQTGAESRSRQG